MWPVIAAVVKDKIGVEVSKLLSVPRAHGILLEVDVGLVKRNGEFEPICLTVPEESANGLVQGFDRANILIATENGCHFVVENRNWRVRVERQRWHLGLGESPFEKVYVVDELYAILLLLIKDVLVGFIELSFISCA